MGYILFIVQLICCDEKATANVNPMSLFLWKKYLSQCHRHLKACRNDNDNPIYIVAMTIPTQFVH